MDVQLDPVLFLRTGYDEHKITGRLPSPALAIMSQVEYYDWLP